MKRLIFAVLALTPVTLAACVEDRGADKKAGDGKNTIVVIDTSMGAIKVELDAAHAPITVKNFLTYVDDKFYDGTIFHRVIEDFMIQGGGFEKGLKDAKNVRDIQAKEKKTRAAIKNESPNTLSNVRGTIAMAHKPELDSATAQFFINVADNSDKLDRPRYCVFGKVIEGMDVVDKIRKVKTTSIVIDGDPVMKDIPAEALVIKSIRRADK